MYIILKLPGITFHKKMVMKQLLLSCTTAFLLLSAFNTRKKEKLRLPEEFNFIPAGSYYTATAEEDSYYYGQTRQRIRWIHLK